MRMSKIIKRVDKIKKNIHMATCRDKIEHLEHELIKNSEKPWRQTSKSRKWLKKQMNRFMRREPISDDDIGRKTGRKPTFGYEY